jgi:hypothetical protein
LPDEEEVEALGKVTVSITLSRGPGLQSFGAGINADRTLYEQHPDT